MNAVHTTEKNVCLDLIAALEMYDGLIGSEETTLALVGEGERESIVIALTNGDEYRLTVRRI